jgi:hypothetical protein
MFSNILEDCTAPIFRVKEIRQAVRKQSRDSAWCLLVSCVDYILTQKVEAVHSSEMSVNYHQITWHHVPGDDRTVSSHLCEDLRCQKILLYCILHPPSIHNELNYLW